MFFFFQAEDGIRDLVRSRGLGDVYKRQTEYPVHLYAIDAAGGALEALRELPTVGAVASLSDCLLYTSDAADDLLCVDLGGRRILKKKNNSHALRSYPPVTTDLP